MCCNKWAKAQGYNGDGKAAQVADQIQNRDSNRRSEHEICVHVKYGVQLRRWREKGVRKYRFVLQYSRGRDHLFGKHATNTRMGRMGSHGIGHCSLCDGT